jgi:hypothetical protein
MWGQFLTRDPIEAITREPYAYAGNNPANFTDPTGLDTCGRPESALDLLGGLVDCVSNPTDWLDRNTETVEQVVDGLSPNVVGTQFCLVLCVGLMRQDGKTYLTYGSVGFGVNTYAGHAWRCADERADEGLFGSVGAGPLSIGGSHGVYDARTHPGGQDHGDNEIDVGFGFGFTIGIFGTKRLEL